ncbi:alpha/beta fold hydrolase [Ideonella sp. 4Y11]|uniref:Alpha/beta fold hydrolase n=1 Tax=Ideonella aquatica TaxID=2824119 RepID=A0A940YML5_9BURK|nr:alpha/beta fold hydrolase [Ideonella aquatica]MBQ0959131.1 alpha/beta fold hydrolase [Ideonella aquatica]
MNDVCVNLDGLTIRCRDAGGTGPAVLLLHGVGGSLELWSAQFAAAHQDLRLLAVDLPGHGLSDFSAQADSPPRFAHTLWALLDALAIHQVHLVGNSLGGAICLQMHRRQPARVRSMLLAASANLGAAAPLPFRLMTLPGLGELMSRPGEGAVARQIQAIFGPDFVVTPELRELIRRNVMRPGAQQAFLGCVRQMTQLRGQRAALVEQAQASLAMSRVPTLLLHGRQDVVIPAAHSQNTAARHPHLQLEVIERCGHTPQLEQPECFNALMRALIRQG